MIANAGDEQLGPVKLGSLTLYPDLVLMDGKKLVGLIEVESAESVNNLEAMAQWVHFANARVPFHLYVPVIAYEATRRLADAYKARITEIWTYRPAVEGFDLVRMHHDAAAAVNALLQAFHELLASLIGLSLTERLLRTVWAPSLALPSSGLPAQDPTP